MSDVREFWIVQHAEKEREAAEPADPGLTQRGRRQARLTAVHLRAAGPFDFIYSSPLRRARHTAEVIAEHLGLAVCVDERLRERMNWGEGAPPQPLAEFLREWKRATSRRDYVPTSGDSSHAAGERFRLFLEELAAVARAPGEQGHPRIRRTILVSHGGVTADLLRTLFGDDALRAAAPDAIDRGIPGCGITRLVRRGIWELVSVGALTHLAGDRSDWRVS